MGARPFYPLLCALLAGLALSVGVAACGGTKISADEVTAAPPELTIPTQSENSTDALTDSGDSQSTDSTGTTSTDADSNDTTGTGGSQGADTPAASGTSTPGNGTGAATPQATATPSNPGATQAPSQSGSTGTGGGTPGTEKFEEFCRQNAGAC